MDILEIFFVISVLACPSIFSLLLSKNDTVVQELFQSEEVRTFPVQNLTNENPTENMVLVPSTEEMEFETTNMSTLHHLNTTTTDGASDEIFDPEETTLVPSTEINEIAERKLPSPSSAKPLLQGTSDEIFDPGLTTTLLPSTQMDEEAEQKLPSGIISELQGTSDVILDPEQTTTLVPSTEKNEIAMRNLPSPIFVKPLEHIVQGTLDKILHLEQTTTLMPSTKSNEIGEQKLPSSFVNPLGNNVQGISNELMPQHNSEPISAKEEKGPEEEDRIKEQTEYEEEKEAEKEEEPEKEMTPLKKEEPEDESEPEEKEKPKEEKQSEEKLIPKKEIKNKKIRKSKLPSLGILRIRRLRSYLPNTRQISLPNIPVISTLIRVFWAIGGTIGSILNDLAAIYNYFYNMHAKAVYEI